MSDLPDTAGHGGVDGGVRVDGDRHPRLPPPPAGQPAGVDYLVGQQQVSPSPAAAMPSTSRMVAQVNPWCPALVLPAGQLGALVGLDVGAQTGPGKVGRHGPQIGVEEAGIDDRRRGLQLFEASGTGHGALLVDVRCNLTHRG